jgi:tripartite-type tricarboxylate transporter receptor subunit TctC
LRRPAPITRRAAASLLAAAFLPRAAFAQNADYPKQLVHIIVPFSPGGPNDIVGRPLAQKLTEALGQSFIIENRPGANGVIGTAVVAKAAPDGYTMLLTTGSFAGNAALAAKLPYDPLHDFAPITQLTQSPGLLLMVPETSPYRTLADLVAAAKRAPGKLNYAMTGNGNITQIVVELFKVVAGINIVPVPYKGTSEAATSLLAGQVETSVISTGLGMPYMANKQLRALAITGKTRTPSLPDVPTFTELGYPEIDFFGYHALWFPAGTPRERVDLIQRESQKALQSPEMRKIVADAGFAAVGSSPEEFTVFLAKDVAQQAAILKRIGLAPK